MKQNLKYDAFLKIKTRKKMLTA